MAQTTKTKLKAHFQAGDIPSEGNYVDLIDSNLNLKETGTQIIVGTLSSSFLEVENHITASGNISASGDITTTNITALGNISASGTITSPLIQTVKIESQPAGSVTLELKSNDLYHNGTSFRTDGNISSSGAIIGSTLAIDSITSTAAELNLLSNVSGLVQADFTKLAAVDATAAELNYSDLATLGTTAASKVLTANANNLTTVSGALANVEDVLTDGSTVAWNVINSPVAKLTLGGNRTLSAPSGTTPISGQFISLLIIQDGTGSRTITWNAAYEFAADTAPTLTATANLGDLFTFRYNGAKWLEVGRNLALTLS